MYNNYYYPYGFQTRPNLFSNLKSIKMSNILDGTQKTLSIINQAIPVIYQIRPIFQNARTALKVVNEIRKDDKKDHSIELKTILKHFMVAISTLEKFLLCFCKE